MDTTLPRLDDPGPGTGLAEIPGDSYESTWDMLEQRL